VSGGRNTDCIFWRETGKVGVGKDNEGVGPGDVIRLHCQLGGTTLGRLDFASIRIPSVQSRGYLPGIFEEQSASSINRPDRQIQL